MVKQRTIQDIKNSAVVLGAEMLKYKATHKDLVTAITRYFLQQGILIAHFSDGVDTILDCVDLATKYFKGNKDVLTNY